MNARTKLLFFLATTFLALWICHPSSAQKSKTPEKKIITGRVLAEVDRPYGAGIGPLWQFLIFSVESENERDTIKPVLIVHAFHNFNLDPPLREAFFDHSKLYELRVVSEPHCDESVSTLSVVKNETATGEVLPPSPGISFVEGVPKDVLKPELVLPCYILSRGNYRFK